EVEYAELRRGVWHRVGERGPASAPTFLRRRAAAFAVVFAFVAVVAAFLYVRRAPPETSVVVEASVESRVPTSVAVSPGGRGAAAPPLPYGTEARESSAPSVQTPPSERVAANLTARVRRQRPVRGEPSGVDRIEFRTANPNVRIIWLVRKAGEKSSSLPAGRNQEVS